MMLLEHMNHPLLLLTLLILTPAIVRATTEYHSGYKAGVYDALHNSDEAIDGTNQTQPFRQGWISGYCSAMGNGFGSHAKCLTAATELASAIKHKNYSQSKGCESPDMAASWLNDVCHYQAPPRAVTTTSVHCDNGQCESNGWTYNE